MASASLGPAAVGRLVATVVTACSPSAPDPTLQSGRVEAAAAGWTVAAVHPTFEASWGCQLGRLGRLGRLAEQEVPVWDRRSSSTVQIGPGQPC